MRRIIDVHTHFTIETSAVAEDAERIGYAVENKSAAEHIAAMNRLGITRAVLSCPTQKYLDNKDACASYCRKVNEMGHMLSQQYPDRFSFVAALPLPYVDLAVRELSYAADVLGAAGVGMCSNYDGIYPGNEDLEPLYQEMERRKLPIIMHPAAPPVFPPKPVTGRILPMFEFIADTTRALLDLFYAGVLNRHPGIRIVVPHSGSCLPVALDRYYGIMRVKGGCEKVPLEQLYFDLACDAYPRGVPILLTLTDTKHILYGTDFPAIPEAVLKKHMEDTLACKEFEGCLENVLWKNADALFGGRFE